MSRHWVICTHDDGDAHLEINHIQGDHHDHSGCGCDHGDTADHGCDGDHPDDPHDSCSHIDLMVEIGPSTEPDSTETSLQLALVLPTRCTCLLAWRTPTRHSLPPWATGPPRPKAFLADRANTVLLI